MITTTEYGKQIILTALGYAKGWREQSCVENSKSCYQYLFDNDYSTVIGKPWCAYFATMVINQAADYLGLNCPIPFQGSSRAVVDYANKYRIRVDRTPKIGSLFWYKTDTGGHTGVVVWMDATGLWTVEGNTGDKLKCLGCPDNGVALIGSQSNRTYQSMINKNSVFVHIEELGNTSHVVIDNLFNMPISSGQQKEQVLNAGINPFGAILLLSAAAGAIYYGTKG